MTCADKEKSWNYLTVVIGVGGTWIDVLLWSSWKWREQWGYQSNLVTVYSV